MIEVFKPQDLPELLNLRAQIEKAVENQAFFNWPESIFKEEVALARVWVARDGLTKIMTGFMIFREEDQRLEIMVLATSPKFQKRGVMSQILHKLQLLAAQQDKDVGLEVHEKNEAARRLYLKLGFKFLHRRKNYYKDGAAAELYLWKSQAELKS